MPNDLPCGSNKPADTQSTEPSRLSVLWTIGHSTRPIVEFIGLIQTHDIQLLADVRTIPYSRHNPQYNQDTLAKSLKGSNIRYQHILPLGGRRKSRPDSVNVGWKNEGFRGYADYMQTQEFWNALEDLMATAQRLPVVIMCAEAVPWRCHRSLISDALVIRGWTVQHIISANSLQSHTLTPFAKLEDNRLTYPAEDPQDSTLPFF